ncbi:hypothetical protein ABZ297_19275 [Nonomuraea sp. NPDC005983]|uniref:hypothetical protein n=1 Tax=Nonomuraea sp. NPDC005983 TaxID=3155595 RepID=UPI0033BEEC8D
MAITEQDLREMLDRDSGDAPPKGVTVADVDRRVRGIRRRRTAVLGAIAAAALAVTAGVLPQQGDVTRAALTPPQAAEPLVTKVYRQGGRAETFTFTAAGREASLSVGCRSDLYALVWLNGELALHGRCEAGRVPPGLLTGSDAVRPGPNEVRAVVIPASAAGADERAGEWADEALAWSSPFPAEWTLQVAPESGRRCRGGLVTLDPGSGQVVRWVCPASASMRTSGLMWSR